MRTLSVMACIIVAIPSAASAQTQRDDRFDVGASLRDVLAAWGEPEERVVRGVKRELVWNYKGGARVVFKDGKVASYRSAGEEQQQAKRAAAAAAAAQRASVEASSESKDILRDIVREIPSGADGPAPVDMPPSGDPNLHGLIPNAVPGRNGQPGIAPGVVIPSPEEDQ